MSASATARRFFDEIWSQGDFDLVDELFAPEYVGHPSGPEAIVHGPAGVKEYTRRPEVEATALVYPEPGRLDRRDGVAPAVAAAGQARPESRAVE